MWTEPFHAPLSRMRGSAPAKASIRLAMPLPFPVLGSVSNRETSPYSAAMTFGRSLPEPLIFEMIFASSGSSNARILSSISSMRPSMSRMDFTADTTHSPTTS